MYITKTCACAVAALALSTGALSAETLKVTITNNQAVGGFSLTPVYTSFHDGSFDAFDAGSAASAGVEEIAELGSPATVRDERLAVAPTSVGSAIGSPSGPPPVQPGETASAEFSVDGTNNRYLSFLSMLLPSNDTFIGNDNATAYEIFDMNGVYLGDRDIEVTAAQLWDAGTEVNDPNGGPAFVAGQAATDGVDENGVVTLATDLIGFDGLTLATGDVLGSASLLSFENDRDNFSLITISVERVAPIPLPASAPLLLGAFGLLGWGARRRQRS
ncbi:MAG: spondin domain-containing protein [Sedimentitalea sp.]